MRERRVRVAGSSLLVAAFLLVGPRPVLAQLPDGPGKETVVKVCGVCHDPAIAASIKLTRDGWQTTIGDMVSRGAKASDEDLNAILDYLSRHFLGEADKPLNMNLATAVELESVLELLRKEAAALIAEREKRKGFTSIDDLKNIPGVPFKKIEAKKDRLVFVILPPNPPSSP
ncbi:MAG: helix-hairpin-helix domain-containing protein [Acidobacteria bacterium]|nr:helix-hairpin-helix domain-containing protein [Acidobacteriota bacterium]